MVAEEAYLVGHFSEYEILTLISLDIYAACDFVTPKTACQAHVYKIEMF